MNVLDVKQGSEAWFAARRGIPTASRFDQIITPAKGLPAAAQDTLINELLAEALLPMDQTPSHQSAAMENGTLLEAEARDFYELGFASAPVKQVGFALHDSGMFGGSPDGLVGEDGGVEIKAPSAPVHLGYLRAGILPRDYGLQVRGYMIVTGRRWWDFMSFHRGLRPFCVRLEWDELTDKLAEELNRFGARYDKERITFGLSPLGKK